jgi:hypothetical protein
MKNGNNKDSTWRMAVRLLEKLLTRRTVHKNSDKEIGD